MKVCGASHQYAFDDRLASTSESVHEALVKAAIIPNGKHFSYWSVAVAFPLLHYIRLENTSSPFFLLRLEAMAMLR